MYTRLKWYPCSHHSRLDGALSYSTYTVNETGRLSAYIMAGGDNAKVIGSVGGSVMAWVNGGQQFTLRECPKCEEA